MIFGASPLKEIYPSRATQKRKSKRRYSPEGLIYRMRLGKEFQEKGLIYLKNF